MAEKPASQPAGQPAGQPAAQEAQQQQAEVVLSEENVQTAYANFARVTANPEEVIIDYGLNPAPFQAGKQEVDITQRMILNFFTAKRLCMALAMTLQKHEGMFGQIELDVRQRVKNPPQGQAQPAPAQGKAPPSPPPAGKK